MTVARPADPVDQVDLAAVRAAVEELCARSVPSIGRGDTAGRWHALYQWARTGSVSVARLAEAHLDAAQILLESGAGSPAPTCLYGVWASAGDGAQVAYDPASGQLSGTKAFCSGLGIIDRALVATEDVDGRVWLCEVDVSHAGPTLGLDTSGWLTSTLAATATGTTHFDRHPVERVVGDRGFYLDRPGFWHGAIGPAACWAGAAAGLVDWAEATAAGTGTATDAKREPDPLRLAALGALRAETWLLCQLLAGAGRDADADPDDLDGARLRAYALRHQVERTTARIADTFSRAFGPRPFVSDPAVAQRLADVHLYARQHHGDADLAALGRLDPPLALLSPSDPLPSDRLLSDRSGSSPPAVDSRSSR